MLHFFEGLCKPTKRRSFRGYLSPIEFEPAKLLKTG
ncbi:hypothetical protein FHS88_003709 [Roseomonas alkaliterrae]|uniref:Uncharacterized protein n=1 Tax=Neoroseomonas alkaliterrae TaxID=1452450 RepID=A0A840YAH9_9PROT|nr:hypothetical protein [Neoroseomonas alkaliterrae]